MLNCFFERGIYPFSPINYLNWICLIDKNNGSKLSNITFVLQSVMISCIGDVMTTSDLTSSTSFFFFFDNLRCSLKEKNTKETTTYRQRQELLVGCLYKQRGFLALRDSFAAAWAATLLFLLTQRNKHPKKLVLKFKILLIILTIDQSGIAFSKARGSIQFFASPSMMMWFQFSWCASWTA